MGKVENLKGTINLCGDWVFGGFGRGLCEGYYEIYYENFVVALGVDRLNRGLHGLRGFWYVFWGDMSVIDGESAPHNALKVLLKVLLKVTVKVTLKVH